MLNLNICVEISARALALSLSLSLSLSLFLRTRSPFFKNCCLFFKRGKKSISVAQSNLFDNMACGNRGATCESCIEIKVGILHFLGDASSTPSYSSDLHFLLL